MDDSSHRKIWAPWKDQTETRGKSQTRSWTHLQLRDGGTVADLGAGGGWFTVRLARRVGPNGLVYAEDIQPQMIESITRRVGREGLANVRTILGTASDPKLPPALDAVLIVDAYPEMADPVTLLGYVATSLKPNGRLGIVNFKLDGGGPGPPLEERIEPQVVIDDAARGWSPAAVPRRFSALHICARFRPRGDRDSESIVAFAWCRSHR